MYADEHRQPGRTVPIGGGGQPDAQPQQYTPVSSLAPAKKSFSGVGLACFVILFVSSLFQIGISLGVQAWAPQLASSPWFLWALVVVPIYMISFPLGLLVFRTVPRAPAAPQHKMRAGQFLICFIMCMALMYAGNLVGTLITSLLPAVSGSGLDTFVYGTGIWMRLLVMVILAPVIEEFIFRKLLLDRIRQFGEGLAILLSGAMFGLFHGNFAQCFYAFALGCMFAYLYLRTGRLRYPILLHMIINFLGGVAAPWILENMSPSLLEADMNVLRDSAWMGAYLESLPSILLLGTYSMFVLCTAIAGLVLLVLHRKKFFLLPAPQRLPRGKGFSVSILNTGMLLFILAAIALFLFSSI